MIELLKAIQAELQNSIDYIKNSNIYIVELDNLIPKGSKFPLVTIKDGGEINDFKLCHMFYKKSQVIITIFNRVEKDGNSTKTRGILSIEEDIFNILINNLLDICYLYEAYPIIQESTKSIKITERDSIAYKRLIMEYKFFSKWT